jgi:hypothetical protein
MLDLTPRSTFDPKKYQRLQCNRFPSLVFADVISVPGYLHSLSLPFQGSETGICMLR